MTKTQDSASPGWSRSFFTQTTEEVVRAFVTAGAAATTNHSPRPSIVFSSKDDNTQLQKLQQHVTRVLQGFSPPAQVKRVTYNPELLTSQKRQWSRFQLQSLDHKSVKEPSNLFESMVVVGLHPNTDIHALQKQFFPRKIEVSGKLSSAFGGQNQARVEPNVEPQVLFVYPPEKQLPLKYKDLLSFCFPAGVEVHAVERTPSMSELNEILLGQEYLKQSDLSFVFRLQVADDSTLYGCCMLVEEIVQKPSSLISMIAEKQPLCLSRSRHILTTRRCYCILTRLPFFDLHFGILNRRLYNILELVVVKNYSLLTANIFTEERLERVTKGIDLLDLSSSEGYEEGENLLEKSDTISIVPKRDHQEVTLNGSAATSDTSTEGFTPTINDGEGDVGHQMLDEEFGALREDNNCNRSSPVNSETMIHTDDRDCGKKMLLSNAHDVSVDESMIIRTQTVEKRLSEAVSPIMRRHHYESSESSTSFQGSPIEDRTFRGTVDDAEMEEPSSSGQEDSSDHKDILDWAKANNHGSLQIICEYYRLRCPVRGTTLTFCPMDHLHPLEFHRPDETLLHIAGSNIDLKSCSNGLEFVEAHNALFAEEEAAALSVWTVAWLCGSLRLEHILTLFAGALLEKHIVVVCSNLGILSASVLSVIALIRPYQWQSLLMPVLPNDMLDFLDAPVPYVVGVKNKTAEVQSKLAGAILVDANKNQIRSPTLPQLPQHKDLFKSLSPYHAKLVGESFLGRRRPVYECTDVQVEAAKGFLAVLRSYLDSLCSNLRSHTITNVQSNDDKVSLLLKESFIDSFPSRDRPFMKLFLDTQLFSVHTDRVLSFYQRD